MKAIVITHPGAPDVLQLVERPTPQLLAGEVLVKVAAAGVNRPDIAQRKGHYPPPPGASADVPGLEVAGTIVEIGADVARWKIGDKVCALLTGGGYAGYCAVPGGQCLPVPANLTLIEAASLPETFFTVWSNVFEREQLKPGETLLVHGGSGGIGVTAIQMAHAIGNVVYTTAGSDEKCLACHALGAAKAINYNTENFKDCIEQLTNGKGVNVILDMIGGDYTPDNLKCLADDGRLVLINAMRSKNATVDLNYIMHRRLTITGSTLRIRDVAFKTAIAQNLEKTIWPLLVSGRIKPIIYKTFLAEEAAEAHQLMESSEHIGKIVLTFSE